jgi:hypothetical protein
VATADVATADAVAGVGSPARFRFLLGRLLFLARSFNFFPVYVILIFSVPSNSKTWVDSSLLNLQRGCWKLAIVMLWTFGSMTTLSFHSSSFFAVSFAGQPSLISPFDASSVNN